MVAPHVSKKVFHAIGQSFPAQGAVLAVTLKRGWGEVLHVDVRMKAGPETRSHLRSAIERALQGYRHQVEVLEAD